MSTSKIKKEWLRILKLIRNPRKILYSACQKYIYHYNGYSYDFNKNGEREIFNRLNLLQLECIFDVGANVGDWTKIALDTFPHATIHCFELSSSTFANLTKNIKSSRVKLNNFGLSCQSGSVAYKDYGENSGVNTILTNARYHDNKIQPSTLYSTIEMGDKYCSENNIDSIDFMKIDVEGAEHLVLYGFSDMLRKKSIRIIQFEYGYAHGDAKFLMRDFFEFYNSLGYDVGRITKNGVEFKEWTYKDNDFTSGPNYLAVLHDDVEIKSLLKTK